MAGNVFVFSFSNEGFESIVNLTEIDQADIMHKLEHGENANNVGEILGMMKVRCMANQHREMEIWLLKLPDDMTEEELNEWAENDPQAVADLAREHGVNVAGGNHAKKKKVIT